MTLADFDAYHESMYYNTAHVVSRFDAILPVLLGSKRSLMKPELTRLEKITSAHVVKDYKKLVSPEEIQKILNAFEKYICTISP